MPFDGADKSLAAVNRSMEAAPSSLRPDDDPMDVDSRFVSFVCRR